jgi:hypothetical protein
MKKDEANGKDVFDKGTGLSHDLTNRVINLININYYR